MNISKNICLLAFAIALTLLANISEGIISFFLKSYIQIYIKSLIFFHNLAKDRVTIGRVEISSVSTRIDQLYNAPKGSINGGTMVFLRARGHYSTPSKNKIFIGPVKKIYKYI